VLTIKFYYNDRIVTGILLSKYQRPHNEVYSVKKRFFWKTRIVYEHEMLNTPLYLIFIPWRHQEKELVEVDEKYIINPEVIPMDETWIRIDKFISEKNEMFGDHSWNEALEINNFIGYRFIYENNSFMIKVCLHEWWEPLTILYQNIPQLLNMDLDNKEG
jgi:hypothetical protein